MIEYIKGDLLESDVDVIAHCCNCFCTMGAGFALALKQKYPSAYAADFLTIKGDKSKLGSYSVAKSTSQKPIIIYNLYGQYFYGNRFGPPIDYNALRLSLRNMFKSLNDEKFTGKLGMPKIGSGLAGGDWSVIEKIIDEECGQIKVHIYTI